MDKQALKILQDLGYSSFFSENAAAAGNEGYRPARVIAEHKETYIVRTGLSEFSAKITGKIMYSAETRLDYPSVGDWVMITILDKYDALIHSILPRKTLIKRKSPGSSDIQLIGTNIDTAFIVESPDRDFSLNRFDRYIVSLKSNGIKPALLLNKTDLLTGSELENTLADMKSEYPDEDIMAVSALTGNNMELLKKYINRSVTYCFLGSSGVGKSSLINILLGDEIIKTGEISSYTQRGKHITTHRHLWIINEGGLLIDTPGMREFALLDSEAGIEELFREIYELALKCRFSNCTHMHEPDCAVLGALESGELDNKTYASFIKLNKENTYHNMSGLEKRKKNRKFGRFCKQSQKEKKKHKS